MSCDVHAAGTIELHFYGELPPAERGAVQAHLARCAECRAALEDLSVIRAALANRPDVATPPGGDWSGFMRRLTGAVAAEQPARSPLNATRARPLRRQLAPYLAVAATLALVTFAVITVRNPRPVPGTTSVVTAPPTAAAEGAQPLRHANVTATDPDPGLLAVSGEHFERSKLVVLGLVTKSGSQDDWAYERDLASSLLGDTRLYRQAAEERGMQPLADVMGDLELVLLQTSMADEASEASLHQLQRLIRRRDLLTKMNAY
jgi:putative zinc finger protein